MAGALFAIIRLLWPLGCCVLPREVADERKLKFEHENPNLTENYVKGEPCPPVSRAWRISPSAQGALPARRTRAPSRRSSAQEAARAPLARATSASSMASIAPGPEIVVFAGVRDVVEDGGFFPVRTECFPCRGEWGSRERLCPCALFAQFLGGLSIRSK